MTAIPPPVLDARLRWRYATKQFDPARPIDPAAWAALEESLVLSPSSYGLQPYRFVVVTDAALKARLRPVSWGQSQITDCSHLVVFAALRRMALPHVDRVVERMAAVRQVPRDSLAGYRGFMVKDLIEGPRAAVIGEWAARQAYIALGTFMTAAALLGVDTCPLEGIEPARYDEILGLGDQFATVVACAAGHRAAGDKYATLAKVRLPAGELIDRR